MQADPANPGLIGIVVIASAAYAVRTVGVLIFGLGSVAGQLVGALSIDSLTPGLHPAAGTWIGTWIGALVAVSAALLLARRPRELHRGSGFGPLDRRRFGSGRRG